MMSSNNNIVAYRRFVATFANKLNASEAEQIAYIRSGSTEYGLDGRNAALHVLLKLERLDVFSFQNPSGLIQIAQDVEREDLVKSVKEFVATHPRPTHRSSRHHTKKRPVPIPNEERHHLEDVHEAFVVKCVGLEGEFQKTWKDTVSREEGLKLLKTAQNIVQELLDDLKQGEKKLKSLPHSISGSSISSSSSDGSTSECNTSPENSLSCG